MSPRTSPQQTTHERDPTVRTDQQTGSAAVEARQPDDMLRELDRQIERIRHLERHASGSVGEAIFAAPAVLREITSEPIRVGPCLVCGTDLATPRLMIEGLQERFITCDQCGLGSIFPMLSAARLQQWRTALHVESASTPVQGRERIGMSHRAERSVRCLVRGVPKSSSILCISCADPTVRTALAGSGYDVHELLSESVGVRTEAARSTVRIARDLIEADYDPGSFDAVFLWDSVEGLTRPDQTLDEIARLLRPGGRVVVTVADYADWETRWADRDRRPLQLPRRLFHFPPGTLRQLLNQRGFRCTSTRSMEAVDFSPIASWLPSSIRRLAPRSRPGRLLAVTAEWRTCEAASTPVPAAEPKSAFAW